jgi:hypothetical protein
MPTRSGIHFYVNWAKERLDEMDATLTSLEGKVGGVQPMPATRPTKLSLTCAKTVMASGTPSRSRRKLTRPLGSAQRQN